MRSDAAQKSPKLHYNSEQTVINLFAIVGCLNWIALITHPDIAWATSRAASLITHDPDTCFTRFRHIYQYLHRSYSGICPAMCSNPSGEQAQIVGPRRCLLARTRKKSQQGLIIYHGITSENKNGGNLVQWRSSRQDLIAKSTCEAELIASSQALLQEMSDAARKGSWSVQFESGSKSGSRLVSCILFEACSQHEEDFPNQTRCSCASYSDVASGDVIR